MDDNKIIIGSHTGFQPLEACVVGMSYPPEFYSKIKNSKVRSVMERIAIETEEDYQQMVKLLQGFGVEVYRPEMETANNFAEYMLILEDGREWYQPPPMHPRDYLLVVGDQFFYRRPRGGEYRDFYQHIYDRIATDKKYDYHTTADITNIHGPSCTRVGKDLYFDDQYYLAPEIFEKYFPDYRCHLVQTEGHSDGVFCPVTPGLIVSLYDYQGYAKTFPGWEVVYLEHHGWIKPELRPFLQLKNKNQGKWWIPGEEMNDDVIDFVNSWLTQWMGYVEETVFDVNMLVIDEKNVLCIHENEKVFKALERYGITPHLCNFRHRFFWDGGLHCNTLDLRRRGPRLDYFPDTVPTSTGPRNSFKPIKE